jgi:thioredoxin reductase (NADPH)
LDSFPACDVLIIGAGPTGLATAIECRRVALSVAILEKGCLVNSLAHYPTEMVFFTTPELLEIGDIPMTSLREKPTRIEALKYYRRVAQHYRLPVRLYEEVTRVEGVDGAFQAFSRTRGGDDRLTEARKVVVATGYYDRPNLLGVPGENLDKVAHYYTEAHPYFDRDVIVVGAKNSAAITALDLYRHGARVTLVHRGEALGKSIKYWIKPDIENRIKNGEIQALFRTVVKEIRQECVLLSGPEGERWVRNDFVLAMTGYHPDFAFLDSLGIAIDHATGRPACDARTYETNVPGVYLAGVVVAGRHTSEIFIENGRFHGQQIAADLARKLAV